MKKITGVIVAGILLAAVGGGLNDDSGSLTETDPTPTVVMSFNPYENSSVTVGADKKPTKALAPTLAQTPTKAPTKKPTLAPTKAPTKKPTLTPTKAPTKKPTLTPTKAPTKKPTKVPTKKPTKVLESKSDARSYVLNTNTRKIHKPSCSSVSRIKATNRQNVVAVIEDLLNQGYDTCKICNPY